MEQQRLTLEEMAQELHRLYCLALAKTEKCWGHMTEIASVWDDLGPERQAFFLQMAKEIKQG